MACLGAEHLDIPFRSDILPAWATSVREELIGAGNLNHSPEARIQCTGVLPPKSGSYNIVFPLQFSDGVRWALKVPKYASRSHFDASDTQAWVSEARTLQLLKRNTTIPIPKVHYFNADLNNSLRYPFILMDFIDGIPLPKVWFDRSIARDLLDKRRLQALQGLAEAMVQLGKFTFPKGGSLQFDHQGNLNGIGPIRRTDIAASLTTLGSKVDADITCDLGPFYDAKSYMLCLLNRRDPPEDKFGRGIYQLLRLFIEWFSELEGYNNSRFVLCHPDLDIQNILVTQDGNLCGILDWEGVAALPECSGNLCYPSFLTRDWDSLVYGYEPDATSEDNELEDSPKELKNLRATYYHIIQKLLADDTQLCELCSAQESDPSKWTRRSLVIENVRIAADNSMCTHGIMDTIFEKIKQFLLQQQPESNSVDVYLYDTVCELVDGTVEEGVLRMLKSGLLGLCEAVYI